MVTLFIGALLEESSKAMESLIITVEERGHGEIDIARIELHVDLLVDQGLAVLMVVLSNLRSHLESVESVACFVLPVSSTHSGAASYQLVGWKVTAPEWVLDTGRTKQATLSTLSR
jgi:hypothetical protein